MKKATAYANANIALVKYWGKNDSPLNIPAVPSLSLTLNDFGTMVSVAKAYSNDHEFLLAGRPLDARAALRLQSYLEQIRRLYVYDGFLQIASQSSIPFAAGLASSAAFYAALAVALNQYLQLGLDSYELSKLARIGSASAARSIFSGLVGLYGGINISHEQAYAFPIHAHPNLDLAMILAVIDHRPKTISSRKAMNLTKDTSPFFASFLATHDSDFNQAMAAAESGSFDELGLIMEHSTLKMFATMWTAKPAINYWQPHSLALINLVYQLRQLHGPIAYFTMDAGPQVKILCLKQWLPIITKAITDSKLACDIRTACPGPGAYLSDTHLL